jgi:hypothetical protein
MSNRLWKSRDRHLYLPWTCSRCPGVRSYLSPIAQARISIKQPRKNFNMSTLTHGQRRCVYSSPKRIRSTNSQYICPSRLCNS